MAVNINGCLPVVGWFISFLYTISLSIPFYFVWNNLAPKYFYFLPEIYQNIPFWDCVGLAIVISILKSVLLPSFSVSNNQEVEK